MGRSMRKNNVRKTKRKNLSKMNQRKNLSKRNLSKRNLSKRNRRTNLSKKNRRKNLSKKYRLYGGMEGSAWGPVDTVMEPPPPVKYDASKDRQTAPKGPTPKQIAAKQKQDAANLRAIQASHSASSRGTGLRQASQQVFGGPTSVSGQEAARWTTGRAEDLARIANVLRSEYVRTRVVEKLNTGFNAVMNHWLAQGITLSNGTAPMYTNIRDEVIAQLKTGRFEFYHEHGSDKKNITKVHDLFRSVKKTFGLTTVKVQSSLKNNFTKNLTNIKCLVRVVTDFTEFNKCKDDTGSFDKLAGVIQRISGSIVYKFGNVWAIRDDIKGIIAGEKDTGEFDADEKAWAEAYLAVAYDATGEGQLSREEFAEETARATAPVVDFMAGIDKEEEEDDEEFYDVVESEGA